MMSSILSRFRDYRSVAECIRDPLYKISLSLALSSIFNAGCGFIFWMIAARMYSVEAVGLATAVISSLGLVVLFSRLGFDFSIIRFFPIGDKAQIFGTCLAITTIASLLIGMAYILLVDFVSPSLAFIKEPSCALLFILIGVANSVAAITGSAFMADRKGEHFLFQNILMALRIPFLIPLAFLGTFGILGSWGLAYSVASLFSLIALRKSLKTIRAKIDMEFIRRSLNFSSWNYASSILSIAPTMLLPIMILNMVGESEAAKYYITFAIGNMVLIIPNSLGTSLFVECSHGAGLKKSVIKTIYTGFIFQVPFVLVLCIFGDRLLGLLKGEYLEAFDLLRILAISSFFVAVYSLFIPIQNVRMNVESIAKLNAIRCLLILGLSYVLIRQYGILGAGYAWLISYGLISLEIGWMAKRMGWI